MWKSVLPAVLVLVHSNKVTALSSAGCHHCEFHDTSYINNLCGGMLTFMSLVQYMVASRCDIVEPCDRAGKTELNDAEFDFIIVGAGVSGPVIARRLSDNPAWKVLLVEAGPEEPSMTAVPGVAFHAVNSTLDWNYVTEPTQPQPTACLETGGFCAWPRGKMVSGTGGMYGMMYVRGHPEIFNKWARAGSTGWSYPEIEHYFERAENPEEELMVSERPRTETAYERPLKLRYFPHKPEFGDSLLAAAKEMGYRTARLVGERQTGFMVAPMILEDGLRGTTSRFYLRPVSKRRNLEVLINAHVTKVLIRSNSKLAYGVELIDKSGRKKVIKARKEVILSAGAIGSPQILLLSGIGPKEDLLKLGIKTVANLPVGKNLHNHVSVGVKMTIRDVPYETMTEETVYEFIYNRTGPVASTGLTQITSFLESSYAENHVPDIQVFFDGFSSHCPRTGHSSECTNGEVGCKLTRREIIARPTAVVVETRGHMKLRSNDPLDHPLLYPNYFSEEKDLKVLLEGVKKVVDLTKTQNLKKWDIQLDPTPHPLCARYHFGSDAYWECLIRATTGPENHQSGTCKMGVAVDGTSVVDPELRVHGITNLRVADASIFPIVPNANPVASIVMIGEKVSDMINSAWQM